MTLKITEFILNLIEKVKLVLNQTGQNSDLTAFISTYQVFCRPEWTKGGPHENEF